jgi:quinohemoprotein ethanol dehydrogenase
MKNACIIPVIVSLLLVACSGNNNQDDLLSDESNTAEWLSYGRTHSEQRFSPVITIDTSNVDRLRPDWYIDLPNDRALVSTPLVVDRKLFFTGTGNIIRAVDATSGKAIWTFDPEVARHIGRQRKPGWTHSRGITYYNNKIFTATWDGRLIALDIKNGREIWSVQTIDSGKQLNITGAPKAFKGKVVIGNGGSENEPTRGYVTAYDAETGKKIWRFYIIPGNPAYGFEDSAMKMAAKTWTGEWWKFGGGGNAWHGLTYDSDLDLLYIGTGNGGPWNRKLRSAEGGDNLFLCSIVALDPDTGEYRWHYQTTPGDAWDYNSCMDMITTTLNINGRQTKVILHAPKNGFFYVINRETGKLISAEPFVETTWASRIDMQTGRPVEFENARYEKGPAYITPSPHGAHSWHAMSYNPMTGLVYIPTIHDAVVFNAEGIDMDALRDKPEKGGLGVNIKDAEKQPRAYGGSLQAWDPVKQKLRWSVPQKELWNAGTLTTAGNLVFQGKADGRFIAYNARTGQTLWTFEAGLGISAPPITYKIDGKQYIALLVGWGGAFAGVGNVNLGWDYGRHTRRLIVFSLEGKVSVPKQPPPFFPVPVDDPTFNIIDSLAEKGRDLYWRCFSCHGANVIAKGMAPDLRASPIPLQFESFREVVKNGSKLDMGMPVYADMTDDELLSIVHFIRKAARQSKPAGGERRGH